MLVSECQVETMKHIELVRKYLRFFTDKLTTRGVEHDRLKLESPEVEIFTEYTPKLAEATYGSEEYNNFLREMGVALQHHYANYRHHPEHFEKGINDMTLIDIVEMLCDWRAAAARQLNGNLLKSIEVNAERFGYENDVRGLVTSPDQASSATPIELMLVRQDGSYIQARTMQHASSVIHYELGVKDFTFHSLRHTHATMLAEAGMPQKYTQQRLGHKDISVTLKYYTHLTDKMSEIGGKILESMFADNDDD